MNNLFETIKSLILETEPSVKCHEVTTLYDALEQKKIPTNAPSPVAEIKQPGYPKNLELVSPRLLKKRGMQKQEGRNVLMHSIAHIEYNAINLALDAAYRFRDQPTDFYHDWLKVASDEARHFMLVNDYLSKNNCHYGHYPAHNGLWSMTTKTAHDIVARMALVPRVLEARGLDVTPAMIRKLKQVGDHAAVSILETIYQDEIEHVRIGSFWFNFQCEQRSLNPRDTFQAMIAEYFHGELKGPFNIAARLQAGFDEAELALLSKH